MIKVNNSTILVLSGKKQFNFYKDILGEDIIYNFGVLENDIFGVKVDNITITHDDFIIILWKMNIMNIIKNLNLFNVKYEYKDKNLIFKDLDGHLIKI